MGSLHSDTQLVVSFPFSSCASPFLLFLGAVPNLFFSKMKFLAVARRYCPCKICAEGVSLSQFGLYAGSGVLSVKMNSIPSKLMINLS